MSKIILKLVLDVADDEEGQERSGAIGASVADAVTDALDRARDNGFNHPLAETVTITEYRVTVEEVERTGQTQAIRFRVDFKGRPKGTTEAPVFRTDEVEVAQPAQVLAALEQRYEEIAIVWIEPANDQGPQGFARRL